MQPDDSAVSSPSLASSDNDLDERQDMEMVMSRALSVPVISYYDLEMDQSFENRLGEGSTGVVFKATWRKSENEEMPVAVKFIKSDRLNVEEARQKQQDALENEAGLHHLFNHENLVQLLAICVAPTVVLVMELCTYGSVRSLLNMALSPSANKSPLQNRVFSARSRCNWALQIAKGIAHLHTHNVIHRDIRADNVFVSHNGIAKLGDFEYSRLTNGATYTSAGGGPTQARWLAPELCTTTEDSLRNWSKKADIYSYGVVLWELLTFREPYDDKRDLEVILGRCFGNLEAPRLPSLRDIPGGLFNSLLEYTELMLQCLATDPNHRPSADEVVARMESVVAHSITIRPVPSASATTSNASASQPPTPTIAAGRPTQSDTSAASTSSTIHPTPDLRPTSPLPPLQEEDPSSTPPEPAPPEPIPLSPLSPSRRSTFSPPAPPGMGPLAASPPVRPTFSPLPSAFGAAAAAAAHASEPSTAELPFLPFQPEGAPDHPPEPLATPPASVLPGSASGLMEIGPQSSGMSDVSTYSLERPASIADGAGWGPVPPGDAPSSSSRPPRGWRKSKVYQSWQKVKTENAAVEGLWEWTKSAYRNPPGTFRSTVDWLTEYVTKSGPSYMPIDPGFCISTPAMGAEVGETFYGYHARITLDTVNLYLTHERVRTLEATFSDGSFLVRGLSQAKVQRDPKRYKRHTLHFRDRKVESLKILVREVMGIATKITGVEVEYDNGESCKCAVDVEEHRANSNEHRFFGCELGSGTCCGVYGKADVNNVTALGFAFLR